MVEKQRREKILASVAETTAMMGVSELASGLVYTEPSWAPPRYIPSMPQARHVRVWKKHCMKFHGGIISGILKKYIEKPSPIQMAGIPAVLSRRDLIGNTYSGSGMIRPSCMSCLSCSASSRRLGCPSSMERDPTGSSSALARIW